MFDGTSPRDPLSSRPNLDAQERRAVGISLVIAACMLMTGATLATWVTMTATPSEQVAFLGP